MFELFFWRENVIRGMLRYYFVNVKIYEFLNLYMYVNLFWKDIVNLINYKNILIIKNLFVWVLFSMVFWVLLRWNKGL